MLRFLAALLAFGLAACNPVENLDEAADQIDRFQNLFSNRSTDEMHLMGSAEFRETTSREDLEDLVSLVAGRLGSIEQSERESFNINTTPSGTRTVVTMATQFELGEGKETYTFIGNGENMQIVGWQVNSDRLLITPDEMKRLDEAPTALEPAD